MNICSHIGFGSKLFYQLPKEKLIYGHSQIKAMLDQDPTISQQLTQWDQSGSHLIRGKQIVTRSKTRSSTSCRSTRSRLARTFPS